MKQGKELVFQFIFFFRYKTYHQQTLKLDLEKLPPTSNSIRLHIQCAFLQAYVWLNSIFKNLIELTPDNYGYALKDDDSLIPVITDEE